MVDAWQQLSVLIAGCGSIGRRHARVLHSLSVRDLRACDPVTSQLEALAAEVPLSALYHSYEAGLAGRPDAVVICTPPDLHIPMAAQAVQAGCHVLCEKPLSDSLDGIDELAAMTARMGRKVMVALCFRYHVGTLLAKRHLESGRVGRLVSIRAMMGEHLPDVRPDYRSLFSAQRVGVFDLVHEIDLALWYAGQPVRRVCSLHGSYSDIGIRAPDLAEVLIEFDDRCLASIHLDFFQRPRRRQLELIATRGVIIVDFASWEQCMVSVYEADKGAWEHQALATQRDDMFLAEDRDFLCAVANNRPVSCTISEGLKSVEVIVAAQRADS